MATVTFVLAFLVMLIGLIGTIVPMIPGIPLIYLGFLIYGLGNHWVDYGAGAMLFWGVVTLLSVIVDYYAGAVGAQKFGASRAGVWGAVLGGIFGVLFLGFVGILVGPFIGAVAGELLSGRSGGEALRSGWGTLLGFFAGSLFKVIVALVMVGTFIWWVIF